MANGALSTGTIINYTTHGNLRVDIAMAIDPTADVDKAKKVALDAETTKKEAVAAAIVAKNAPVVEEEMQVMTKVLLPSRKLKIKISNELLFELEKMKIKFSLN